MNLLISTEAQYFFEIVDLRSLGHKINLLDLLQLMI